MFNRNARLVLILALFLTAVFTPVAQAAEAVTFTVTVSSAYLRGAPGTGSPRLYSVFRNQSFTVTGRTADNAWLRLSFSGGEGWMLAAYGAVTGDLASVPITAAAAAGAAQPTPVVTASAGASGNLPALGARFTLMAKSTYLRTAPALTATRLISLFKGQTFPVNGRSADTLWIQINNGGTVGWVSAGLGTVTVPVLALPVVNGVTGLVATPTPTPAAGGGQSSPPVVPDSDGMPVITPRMHQIYDQTAQHGNSPFAFAIAGDCNSMHYIYLELVAAGKWDVSQRPDLQETIGRFYPSFMRASLAVHGGYNSASMFNPLWSDPKQCQPDEGPFACELRVMKASVVFIALGTGDHLAWQNFESNYRRMIDYALARGVLPVLVTKADNLEFIEAKAPSDYINTVIRRLGQEYEVPVMDLGLATQKYYNHGLTDEGLADFHFSVDGIAVHVNLTLETLNAIWRK